MRLLLFGIALRIYHIQKVDKIRKNKLQAPVLYRHGRDLSGFCRLVVEPVRHRWEIVYAFFVLYASLLLRR